MQPVHLRQNEYDAHLEMIVKNNWIVGVNF